MERVENPRRPIKKQEMAARCRPALSSAAHSQFGASKQRPQLIFGRCSSSDLGSLDPRPQAPQRDYHPGSHADANTCETAALEDEFHEIAVIRRC